MKNKILKFIFILSFIPYIYLLYGILFGKYIINGVELQGLERLSKIIKTELLDLIYISPIIPTCLTFQMCYIFRNKTKIMFLCSFIPYLLIILLGLRYAIFGGNFLGDNLSYGFNGFIIGIISGFIYYAIMFPLLPICLIFQIICIIKNKKSKKLIYH